MKKFKLDYSFFILFIIILFSPKQAIILKLILVLFLHELGHLLCILLFRYRIASLRLSIFGFFLTLEDTKEEFLKDVIIYCGGILSNLASYLFVPVPTFKMISLILICINSLPIYPLDGYNALKSILAYFLPYYHTNRIMGLLSLFTAGIVAILAIYFHYDVYIILNLIYLLLMNLNSLFKSRLTYQHFLLKKKLYPKEYPLKQISFHDDFWHYIYKYHSVVMKIGDRKITEKELLEAKNIGN